MQMPSAVNDRSASPTCSQMSRYVQSKRPKERDSYTNKTEADQQKGASGSKCVMFSLDSSVPGPDMLSKSKSDEAKTAAL